MNKRLLRPCALGAAFAVLGLIAAVAGGGQAGAAEAPVGLGTSSSFAVLAGSTVTNTGPSTIGGSVGVSAGSAVTGFPPGLLSSGSIHKADAVAAQAQSDATTAYDDAAGRTPFTSVATELGGTTLAPGVYRGATLAITGTLTLDAKGDPNAVFVFQTGSTLITATDSQVVLINGASPCNVFWQVPTSATLGVDSKFVGTVLAHTSIQAKTGASVQGRLFASTAAVTLDTNTITTGSCANNTTTTTTTAAASAASTTTAAATSNTTAAATSTTQVPAAAASPVPGTSNFTG